MQTKTLGIVVAAFIALALLCIRPAVGASESGELTISNGTGSPVSAFLKIDGREELLCRGSVTGGHCGYSSFSLTPGPNTVVAKKDDGTVIETCGFDISAGQKKSWIIRIPSECDIS